MKGRNLSDNKGAMLSLKYMAIAGVSTKKIVEELHEAYGHRWSTSTVVRNVNSSPVPTKTRRNKPVVQTRSVASYFKGVIAKDLSFGDLSQYTASFFEELAMNNRKPKGERKDRMPRDWWKGLERRMDMWHEQLLTEVDVIYGLAPENLIDRNGRPITLTPTQKMAYDLCRAIYRELKKKGKSDFRTTIFPTYQQWRDTFLSLKSNKEFS